MNKVTLLLFGILAISSCSHPYNLDSTGSDQFDVCASACYISSSIRDDERLKAAYVKANDAINDVFRSRDYSKQRLCIELQKSLASFPGPVMDRVVTETLRIYDNFSSKDEIWALQMTQEAILLTYQSRFFNKFL